MHKKLIDATISMVNASTIPKHSGLNYKQRLINIFQVLWRVITP